MKQTNKFTLLFSLFFGTILYSQVGINTSEPKATLDIAGNMIIQNVSPTNGGDDFGSLVRDNNTGEIKVAASSTGNTKPITIVQYNINNVNSDCLRNYDTKIKATDYTLVVVGSTFNRNLNVKKITSGADTLYYYTPFYAFAFIENGTWRITADYDGTNTFDGVNGNWQFMCLAISNSIAKSIPNISQNLDGSATGAAAAPPSGL